MDEIGSSKENNWVIRQIKSEEFYLLDNFLYEAIFIPEGVEAPPREIINTPELQVYVKDFGAGECDICFVAEVEEKIVGAVWVRIMNDYGHVEDFVPSFAISLYKEYRGLGIGTSMMKQMLLELKKRGYNKASLAVQKANYAVKMYKKVGFEVVDENEEEYIMICRL
ncbi:MAG: GNAT family N-acetyltransferase [Lachnospiraceae bacterium]|nr:GNAT family N-acetyltransferase [Lachnospiraceae bacterium]